MLSKFSIILPELSLVALIIVAQILAVFCTKSASKIMNATLLAGLLIAGYFVQYIDMTDQAFHNSFAISPFINQAKLMIFICSNIAIIVYKIYCNICKEELKIEFLSLILLSSLGLFVAISARDLLLLFCGLELQSLASYALVAFNTKSLISNESGIKYFILSALISCVSLLGISFIYGYSGSLQLEDIGEVLNSPNPQAGLVIGVILLLSNIFFRLSAAPFHFWAPDVYEGALIPVIIYFNGVKIGLVAILINMLNLVVKDYSLIAIDLFRIVAVFSMIFGACGAIMQVSLKRIVAYSTILNVGFVIMALTNHNEAGLEAAMFYIIVYTMSVIGFLMALILLIGEKAESATIKDISGAASSRKAIAAIIALLMFSMIGIPPFAGFFGKYYVFYNAILEKEYLLTFAGIAASIISSYYSLNIVQSLYFNERNQAISKVSASKVMGFLLAGVSIPIIFFALK